MVRSRRRSRRKPKINLRRKFRRVASETRNREAMPLCKSGKTNRNEQSYRLSHFCDSLLSDVRKSVAMKPGQIVGRRVDVRNLFPVVLTAKINLSTVGGNLVWRRLTEGPGRGRTAAQLDRSYSPGGVGPGQGRESSSPAVTLISDRPSVGRSSSCNRLSVVAGTQWCLSPIRQLDRFGY